MIIGVADARRDHLYLYFVILGWIKLDLLNAHGLTGPVQNSSSCLHRNDLSLLNSCKLSKDNLFRLSIPSQESHSVGAGVGWSGVGAFMAARARGLCGPLSVPVEVGLMGPCLRGKYARSFPLMELDPCSRRERI